jgi:hypothetical protein
MPNVVEFPGWAVKKNEKRGGFPGRIDKIKFDLGKRKWLCF